VGEAELGVVLRTTPLRESDLLVVLLTSEHGRITAVARGGRKSQRRFAGTLQLLVLGRYQLGRPPRGELWNLESADIVREWNDLASDVVAVAHASYVAELAGALLPTETPEPHALELIVALWDTLAAGGPSPAALRTVELGLLDLAGHRLALDACAACGRTELAAAVFDPTRGGVVCRICASTSRTAGVRMIEANALDYLRAAAAVDNPIEARTLDHDPRFAPSDRTAARDAMIAMVQMLVGKPLKSLEYIAKLASAGRKP
jgi:DNA repair protein RecO (recombination protein O)